MGQPAELHSQQRLLTSPSMKLRLEWGTASDSTASLPSWASVEWAGRVGHPTSYGLLGGAPSRTPEISVPDRTDRFLDSLAGRGDDVRWGLPTDYAAAVLAVLVKHQQSVTITRAAHGYCGSSEQAFSTLALFLCRILSDGVPVDDAEVWKLHGRCWYDTMPNRSSS